MSIAIVAEKPSVARDIAACVGARTRHEGYLSGNGYVVTWAIGHLVGLAQPHEIEARWKAWRWDQLPMLPTHWPLVVLPDARGQFEVVRRVLASREVDAVVCATDAGREGELIFRYLYEAMRCKKPTQRLWISSLTPDAIRAGMARLRPSREFDGLAAAARGRAQADWLVGMNLSRAYSIGQSDLFSVGRVQTPTLALLVTRELEIAAFVPEKYVEVVATFEADGQRYRGTWYRHERGGTGEAGEIARRRLPPDGVEARAIVERVRGVGRGVVASMNEDVRRLAPPLLYDLSELQRHANRLYGYSAQRTLQIAQALYERRKLITYPRTDSRHLSADIAATLPDVTAAIAPAYPGLVAPGTGGPLGRRFVDDAKVSDHHAIIPTPNRVADGALTPEESRIYDLICRRLLAAWHEDHVYAVTHVITRVGEGDHFHTRGTRVITPGWKCLDVVTSRSAAAPPRADAARGAPDARRGAARSEGARSEDERPEDEGPLPPGLREQLEVPVRDVAAVDKETKPPRRLTEANLLTAMETAGATLDDKELSRAMKDRGLGTPATRAATIETLIAREYVSREGKVLRPTPKGMLLVERVHPTVKSAALTGEWEARLRAIERGEAELEPFMRAIEALVREVLGGVGDDGGPVAAAGPTSVEAGAPEAGAPEPGARGPGARGPGAREPGADRERAQVSDAASRASARRPEVSDGASEAPARRPDTPGTLQNTDPRRGMTIGTLQNTDPRRGMTIGTLQNTDPRRGMTIGTLQNTDPRRGMTSGTLPDASNAPRDLSAPRPSASAPRPAADLPAPERIRHLLTHTFGHAKFRPHQEEVCRAATEGRDVLLVMPTGAGKSLCYQLPGLARGGTTLVVSPLIALMEDQVTKLQALGLNAARVHSGRSRTDSRAACVDYVAGRLDFLFVAPERLGVPGFIELLARRRPTLIAIDEAHCISQWGHDFRPEYRMLGQRLPELRPAPVIALTATATPSVQADIAEQLGLAQGRRFIHGFRRTNLALEVVEAPKPERPVVVERILSERAARPALIYTASRKEAEALAEQLAGVCSSAAYHAGMSASARDAVQSGFLGGRIEVVAATVAFGMGVDKADIRTVIHTALPQTVEGYYQEIGRAGRDGNPSRAILLHSFVDRRMHAYFLDRSYPPLETLERVRARITSAGVPRDEVYRRARLTREVAEAAVEKLWIHGGVLIDADDVVRPGHDAWPKSYATQRAHRETQAERMAELSTTHACRMLHVVRHFGDETDSGAPCGVCDVCAPAACVVQPFRAPTPREVTAMVAILDGLGHSGGRGQGAIFRELEARGAAPGLDRDGFEVLISGLARAGLVAVRSDVFDKDGEQIRYQRVTLTEAGRAVEAEALAELALPSVVERSAGSGGAGGGRRKSTRRKPRATKGKGRRSRAWPREEGAEAPARTAKAPGTRGRGKTKAKPRTEDGAAFDLEAAPDVRAPRRRRTPATSTPAATASSASSPRTRTRPSTAATEAPSPLVDALRTWRLAEARRQKTPAFRVLNDRTLAAIAAVQPRTPEALLAIRGMGPALARRYGAALVALVERTSRGDGPRLGL